MSTVLAEPAPAKVPEKLNTRAAGAVGIAVMCSRLLGLAREQALAHVYGAGFAMDAFQSAFRVPNLLRDLFAEGALSTAFVTTFTKKIAEEGDAAAWKLANKVATLATVTLTLVSLLGMLAAPLLVKVLVHGFSPEKAALTTHLTQVMFPFILLVSLAALVMGMLNAKNVFGVPAMSSSFFNIGSIVGGLGLAWLFDHRFGPASLTGLALGTLLGGLLQLVVQFPALRRVGYRFRPDFLWRDPGVKQVLWLMGPAVIAASAVQVNVMVNGRFASELPGDGPVSWLNVAFRLMQLPLGIFGVAIGTVTLPLISRSAAAGNTVQFRSALARGMRLAFLLTAPSTIGLMMLARPIMSLLYEHGHFTPSDSDQTAAALRFYAIGLAAYSGIKVLAPAFYAIDKRTTPMMVSFASIGINLLLNWLLTFRLGLGFRGLALSTGCVALINFTALYLLMRREIKLLETRLMITTMARLLPGCLLLAAVCWAGQHWVLAGWSHYHMPLRALSLFSVIGVGGVAFFAAAMVCRVEEVADLTAVLKRKFGRRRA